MQEYKQLLLILLQELKKLKKVKKLKKSKKLSDSRNWQFIFGIHSNKEVNIKIKPMKFCGKKGTIHKLLSNLFDILNVTTQSK